MAPVSGGGFHHFQKPATWSSCRVYAVKSPTYTGISQLIAVQTGNQTFAGPGHLGILAPIQKKGVNAAYTYTAPDISVLSIYSLNKLP